MSDDAPPEVRRRCVNGVTLEVAEAGPRDGPLVILLHGFPDLWQGWQPQIAPLASAGLRLLLPNQRGYGKSDKPKGVAAYDLDILVDDAVALAQSEQRSQFAIVGHDWGGIVAWWAAARYPQHVRRVAVLNAPHPGAFKRYLLRHPTQLVRSSYAFFFQLPWLPERLLSARRYAVMEQAMHRTSRPGTMDPQYLGILREGWSQPGSLQAMLNYYRAGFRRRAKSLQQRVTQPALVLWGTGDPALALGLAWASKAYCDDCQLVQLPEASHWIQREESQRVSAELLRFLA